MFSHVRAGSFPFTLHLTVISPANHHIPHPPTLYLPPFDPANKHCALLGSHLTPVNGFETQGREDPTLYVFPYVSSRVLDPERYT